MLSSNKQEEGYLGAMEKKEKIWLMIFFLFEFSTLRANLRDVIWASNNQPGMVYGMERLATALLIPCMEI
jgi:hypothetical protein